MEHLLTENERITAKEGGQGGLTEGQQAQLARNDKTITAVRLQASRVECCVPCLLSFSSPTLPLTWDRSRTRDPWSVAPLWHGGVLLSNRLCIATV